MSNYKTFEDIKQKYNLVDTILSYGFIINNRKSSGKWTVFKKDEEKLLYNKLTNRFFNPDNDKDNGDVIAFVANRINGYLSPDKSKEAIFNAIETLENKDFSNPSINQVKQKKVFEKKQKMSITSDELNYKELNDKSYLVDKRFISHKTLNNPLFKDTIFNTYFKQKNGHIFTNTAFGLFKDNKVVGLNVHYTKQDNSTAKVLIGNTNALNHSNFSQFKTIDRIFIVENAVDYLSFFDIFSEDLANKNCFFISFNGHISDEKIIEFNTLIKAAPINEQSKYISLFDNDKTGYRYDIMLLSILLNQKGFINNTQKVNALFNIITFNALDNSLFLSLSKAIEKYNNTIKNGNLGDYIILKKEALDNAVQFNLNIPKLLDLRSEPLKDILKIFNLNNNLTAFKPKNFSDWNDYLISKKKNSVLEFKQISSKKNNLKISM